MSYMIRRLYLPLALLVLVASAHAQFSLYGSVSVEKLSGIQGSPVLSALTPGPCPAAGANCTAYNNSVNPGGFTGGVTYDIRQVGPVMLSADARGMVQTSSRGAQSYSIGSGTRIYSGLAGVRAGFQLPIKALRPYVQASAGYARSNYGVLTNASVQSSAVYPGIPTQNNIEYHVFTGMDIHILPVVDLRLVELGYGGLSSLGTYSHNYPMYSIGSGVVFHFPPRP